jgi:hypothetical protein
MPEMNKILEITFGLALAILLNGCGDKATIDSAKSPLSGGGVTNQTAPAANEPKKGLAESSAPITGEFGWTLGQKIPDALLVNMVGSTGLGFHRYQTSTNPPFETIVVGCTRDRTINKITGSTTNTGKLQYDALVNALNQKYGVAEDTKPNDVPTRTWIRPAAGREVQIQYSMSEGISVAYIDLIIVKPPSDKP